VSFLVSRFADTTLVACVAALACALWTDSVRAATCQDPAGFTSWLESFKQDAATKGISQKTIASALAGLTSDPDVVSRDRRQEVFQQSFEQFSKRAVSTDRLKKGANMLKRYGSILARIEKQYGVPGSVVVAIWGLETDFGANLGSFATVRSLATLAFDCRRSELFRAELLEALRIIENGDMAPEDMRGAWAGEIGQTQFMPSSYVKFAVDFDNNGKRDLIRSVPDALASTANFLKSFGWSAAQPWAPGSPNFDVLLQWNKSKVYSQTVGYFATRLEREP
jgi:lytic murein transglycosylase